MFPEERRKSILQLLNKEGRCRVASLANKLSVSEVTIRMDLDVLEKQGLLRRTRSEGDTIILDVGTTVMEVARHLVRHKNITVVTNALNVATLLENCPEINVIVTGGKLRATQHSLVNPYANLILDKLYADITFIGASGIDARYGVTNVNIPEAEMKIGFINASRRRILLADSSKIGNVAQAKVGKLEDFHLLITDNQAEPEQVRLLQVNGLPVDLV